MTIKRQIICLAGIAIAFNGVLSGILFLRAQSAVENFRHLDKVARMLGLFSRLSDSVTDETNFSWDAWVEVKEKRVGAGKQRFDEAVTRTDLAAAELAQLVASMRLTDYSADFQQTAREAAAFGSKLIPLRAKVIGPGQAEANWPTTREYLKEVNSIVALIPALSSDTTHGELLRRMVVANSLVRFKLAYTLEAGALYYCLEGKLTGEDGRTNSVLFKTQAQEFASAMQTYGTRAMREVYRTQVMNGHLEHFLSVVQEFASAGTVIDGKTTAILKPDAEYLRAVKADMAALDTGVDAAIHFARDELTQFTQAEIGAAERARRNALAIGLGSLIACALVAFRFARQITRTVENVSEAISAEAGRMLEYADAFSQTSHRLAEGGSQQASAVERIGSSMSEMHTTAKSNLKSLENVLGLGTEANTSARESSDEMQRLTRTMDAMKASGEQIGEIAKTIEEIAFQTNILALNASIEAARAGDAGAGFGVVADEVRNLAKRSAESANSTRTLIERATEQIATGHGLSRNVNGKLQAIAEHLAQFQTVLKDVGEASGHQNHTIGEITQAIEQIDEVTQTNAAGAEQSANTAEELQDRAQQLLAATHQLAALCGRDENSGGSAAATKPGSGKTSDLKPKWDVLRPNSPSIKKTLRPQLR